MAKQILRQYLTDIDKLKDGITDQSKQILKAIDIGTLIQMTSEQKRQYLSSILMDFWEAQDSSIIKAIKLGEDKARKLINGSI